MSSGLRCRSQREHSAHFLGCSSNFVERDGAHFFVEGQKRTDEFPYYLPIGHPARMALPSRAPNMRVALAVGDAWFSKCMDARQQCEAAEARANVLEAALLEMIDDSLLLSRVLNYSARQVQQEMAQIGYIAGK